MLGAYLPGGREVDLRAVPEPEAGPGQVVVAVRASTICGSDLRAIYREHLGEGPEAYQGVIGGHEPCGQVVAVGPGVRRVREGDRVVVYHISGCGQCDQCRRGYQISCVEVSGRDRVLVTGLGPVGLMAAMFARAMGPSHVVGTDPAPARRDLALSIGVVGDALDAVDPALDDRLHALLGDGAEVAVECSGAGAAQLLALRHTARWGRAALVGEGGRLTVDVSEVLIHRQLTVHGSWVAPVWRMDELLQRFARWDRHPEDVVTDRYPLADARAAYARADTTATGKVAITPS